MKQTYFFLLVAALLLSIATPIAAQKRGNSDIDFGTMTCNDFMHEVTVSDEEDLGALLLWIDGYLSGVTGDTVLRWRGFEQFAEDLVVSCQRRGHQRLLDAARRVGIEG
jgi:acid stress chaperone HdeB